MRHYLTHAAVWLRGLFGQPAVTPPEIPPPPVKNDIDPEEDQALAEMGESLEELDWRRVALRRQQRAMRRGRE